MHKSHATCMSRVYKSLMGECSSMANTFITRKSNKIIEVTL